MTTSKDQLTRSEIEMEIYLFLRCWRCGGRFDQTLLERAELVVGKDLHVLVHVDCMIEGDRERLA